MRRPFQVRISYDADLDLLLALRPGEAVDGEPDEAIEIDEGVFLLRRHDGLRKGFAIEDLYDEDRALEDIPEPRYLYRAPTLGLHSATLVEVALAARAALQGQSTPDVVFFDNAVEEVDNPVEAEFWWRGALEAGELKAHSGLGYTLFELERYREAYSHLRFYTEVVPRNSWAWSWRGQAADAIGEHKEAIRCYRRAIRLEAEGSYETDAEEHLEELLGRRKRRRRDRSSKKGR